MNDEPEVKKVKQGNVVQAPDWCNIKTEQLLPINGFIYKCIGYTEKFEVVLKCTGMTSSQKSHYKATNKKFPIFPE